MTRRILLAGAFAALFAAGLGLGLPAPSAAQMSGEDARDLSRISNYLNGVTTLEGTFVQIDHDGELSEGLFYMRRPGRIRFEYKPPNPALVIADGTWVGVYDTRLNTLDRIPLGSTPLDLLLSERVDLRSDNAIRSIERAPGLMRVTAIDPDAPDQGSITMVFAEAPLELRQWIVIDAQGLTTTVALSEMRSNVKLDPKLFFIEDPKR
jgi:outer membrane lipoprotein-sorting protein